MKQSGKFEDLSQSGLRLNHLIERYEILYSQGRLDALDELDGIPQLRKMKKREEIKIRVMIGVMIVSSSLIFSALSKRVLHRRFRTL